MVVNAVFNIETLITLKQIHHELMAHRTKELGNEGFKLWLDYGESIQKFADKKRITQKSLVNMLDVDEKEMFRKSKAWELTSLGFPGFFRFEKKK